LHGWLLGGRQEFLPQYVDGHDHGHFAYHWNVPWFASRGYVAVAATTRGVANSCGLSDQDPSCVNGYLHLAQREYEVRDAQHVLGTLVDAGVADPDRLAASGGSLGGGMTWLLATSFPWDTPAPGTRQVKLAAAVPHVGWSDLLGALIPNGRATDDPGQDVDLGRPFGIPKTSTYGGLIAIGRADPGIPLNALVGQSARYNEANPSELHSFINGHVAIANSGEPYDLTPAPASLVDAYRDKSPYQADAWLEALARGEVDPVPTYAVSGWMDVLFPAVETLQMYRRLRAADPDYPIEIAFGGFAHKGNEGRRADWVDINDAGNAFLDAVLGTGESTPRPAVRSFVAQCSPGSRGPHIAASWDGLAPLQRTFRAADEHTTTATAPDHEDVRHDPVIGPPLGDDPICKTEPRTRAPEAAEWRWDVGAEGFTMAGLARVEVDYALSGVDATILAKLWDVRPDGTRTLVDRGVYRLATLADDPSQGRLDFKLFGSSWNFEPGHQVQLELAQTDGVAFRADDLPSAITFDNPALTLPSLSAGG
jgi:predicted acyl esterase